MRPTTTIKTGFRRWGAVALVALTSALSSALFQAPAHAETWIHAESDHFIIDGTAPEGKTRAFIKKLEAFRTLTNLLLGSSDAGPQVKFQIYLLNNPDEMQSVRPNFSRYVAGVYFNCGEGTSAYSTVQPSMELGDDQDQSLVVLFHEYSHYVMFQHARTYYPQWYVEGFAEYLSTASPANGKITIGEDNKGRGYTLAEDRWIDFAKVLNPDFGFTGDKHNNDWEIESFYAQSWLLTHYMLSDSDRTKALNAYFVQIGQGADPVTSFEATTGIKVKDLQRLLQRYQEHMAYLNVPITDYPDANIQITHQPAENAAFVLNGSLLTTCVGNDQGKAILSGLTAQKSTFASNEDFRFDLARAEILFGNPANAEADMTLILTANPSDFSANYLLGRAYFREADDKTGDDKSALIDQARSSFIAAYKIKKLDAPNLYFLARSFSDRPNFPDLNVVHAATGAHVLAPGVAEYATFAAFADLINNQRDDAVALLTPFVSDPHNHAQAERIKTAIDAIKAGKSTSEVMKILNGSPPAKG